jgi:Tfp pilus assembly protein PilN
MLQIVFFIFLLCSTALVGQGVYTLPVKQSQETTNALLEARLDRLDKEVSDNTIRQDAEVKQFEALKSSMDRFTGIGIGIGVTLTMLQGILLLLTYRNGNKQKI